jgi:hypothetical protein
MKTTIIISDDLVSRARVAMQRDNVTLRALVEAGLDLVLRARAEPAKPEIVPVTFTGHGLAEDLQGAPWESIRDRAYELDR